MVASECAPAAKAGGLGDVVSGLSRELEVRGNEVEIILPKYAGLRYSDIWGLKPSYRDLWVPWYGGAVRCTVWFGYAQGRKCYFIEPHWNPEADRFLSSHYSADRIHGKSANTDALRNRFWLRKARGPVVAYVGRLDEQKGMPLVHHALFYTLANGGQFVLIGDANHHDGINAHFWHLKDYLGDNPDCHLEIGYCEDLAHLVYAGADLLVAPSMFEPCGLAPMIGMRYGTVPVVRATGGLIDTVFDRDNSGRPPGERNGFAFHHTDNQAIESALSRALRLWSTSPREFRNLAVNGMRTDYSWAGPGRDYLEIYVHIRRTSA